MLKYEGLKEKQSIRAYDFEPIPGRRDRFIEGIIKKIGFSSEGAKGYFVDVTKDTVFEKNGRTEVFVPMEMSIFDFEGRVTLL